MRRPVLGTLAGLLVAVFGLLTVTASVAAAEEDSWPQWRGPQRDGHAPSFRAPQFWPKVLNLRWKVAVGEGHSSPVVAGDKIFLLHRRGDDEVVSAFALHSGKELWSHSYPARFAKNSYATGHPPGPFSTPAVADGRLFTLGVGGVLSAWSTTTGELLWRHSPDQPLDTSKLFTGTASSPLVDGERLIAHLGDDAGGRLVAFDVASGQELWSWQGPGPGYASPILGIFAGRRQVVTLTDHSAVGVSAAEGELLWSLVFEDEWNENIMTPVVAGDHVLVGGVRQGLTALSLAEAAPKETASKEAAGTGLPLASRSAWHRPDLTIYMSTPVVDDGVVYGFSNKEKGHVFALDAATGETLWTSPGRLATHVSLIDGGPVLLALTTDAELLVIEKSREAYLELRRLDVGTTATWAHPALVERTLIVKEATALASWNIGNGVPPPKPMAMPKPEAAGERKKLEP